MKNTRSTFNSTFERNVRSEDFRKNEKERKNKQSNYYLRFFSLKCCFFEEKKTRKLDPNDRDVVIDFVH